METNRIKKAMAILLAVMFLLTVTVGAASAWGCGGWGGCGSPKPMSDSVKFTDKSISTTSIPAIYGNKVVWSDSALSKSIDI